MRKFTRAIIVTAMVSVMALGSIAFAQDKDAKMEKGKMAPKMSKMHKHSMMKGKSKMAPKMMDKKGGK